MKCEKCGKEYPSSYYFKDNAETTRLLCNDCCDSLTNEEIEFFLSESNLQQKETHQEKLEKDNGVELIVQLIDLNSTLPSYEPSRKHPGIHFMILLALLGGLTAGIAGAIGVPAIWEVILRSFGRGGIISSILIIVFLGIVIPLGMGYLASFFPSYKSRNPKLSLYFGIISGVLAILVMIRFHMVIMDISFVQWIRLDWISPTGRPIEIPDISGYFILGFLHLVPMAITILSVTFISESTASDPYCENCDTRCSEIDVGKVDGKMSEKKLKSIISKESFDDIIKPLKKDLQSPSSFWSEVKAHICKTCNNTGYLTLEYHWPEQDEDGNEKEESQIIILQCKMNIKQIENMKNIANKVT